MPKTHRLQTIPTNRKNRTPTPIIQASKTPIEKDLIKKATKQFASY
jgi:hypothetical protein